MSEIKRETVETLLRFVGERCGWERGPGGEWWLSTDGQTLADTATDAHLRELLGACGDWAAERDCDVVERTTIFADHEGKTVRTGRLVRIRGRGGVVGGTGPTRADAWAAALTEWEEATR